MGEVFEQSPTSGQPSVLLQHPNGASCEIQLHGATVTSYKTAQGREVLFLSQTAAFNGCQAIRGGIPVVFPQFLRPDPTLPSHGFARTSAWELSDEERESGASPGAVAAVLTLSDSAATRALWPFAFHLRYVVELGETQLTTTLHITNTSDAAFRCQALLHTYLAVEDISQTAVTGLKGLSYRDQLAETADSAQEAAEARAIAEETDTIFMDAGRDVHVESGGITTVVKKSASQTFADGHDAPVPVDTVLWNPWEAKGAGMKDLERDGYQRFVCVEPGLVSARRSVAPSERLTLAQTLAPSQH
eukprot:TRINITY_DN4478_c0_g1_i1.p1 TRINITY_DN4478_c0_g1~~TRINITY_DN4478_c0_g1_i1.p1  ORF type:complete len:303 (-),score=80.61 TRINITY_DN4478_c0_g1_i1:112-1020(-)